MMKLSSKACQAFASSLQRVFRPAAATTSPLLFSTFSAAAAATTTTTSTTTNSSSLISPNDGVLIRSFHSSPSVSFAVHRRRGQGGGDSSDDGDDWETGHKYIGKKPIYNKEEFEKAAEKLLDKIHEALLPLKDLNDPFDLNRGVEEIEYEEDKPYHEQDQGGIGGPTREHYGDADNRSYLSVDLGPGKGLFKIVVNVEQRYLVMSTPVSGQYLYYAEKGSNDWFAAHDGHSLEGMFVRDMIKLCYGVPNL